MAPIERSVPSGRRVLLGRHRRDRRLQGLCILTWLLRLRAHPSASSATRSVERFVGPATPPRCPTIASTPTCGRSLERCCRPARARGGRGGRGLGDHERDREARARVSDDLLSATLLEFAGPLVVAPRCTRAWEHPAT